MNLFFNSMICALLTVAIAMPAGFLAALQLSAASGMTRMGFYAVCGAAMLLPPFMVTNAWLDLFGRAGAWAGSLPFDLYGFVGVAVLIASFTWPVVAFIVHIGWKNISESHFESDPELNGRALISHMLIPAGRSTLLFSAAVVFVIAFNQFSIPAILQVNVLPVETWIAFSTNLNVARALMFSLPLVVVVVLFLMLVRGGGPNANAERNRLIGFTGAHDPSVFRKTLGGPLVIGSRVAFILLVMISLGLPLFQLVSSPRTWHELVPAFQSSRSAIFTSLTTAAMVAALVMSWGLVTARFRAGVVGWFFFLVPGVFMGVLLGWFSNYPPVSWAYGTSFLVWVALLMRYGALGWSGVREMFRRTDVELSDAAKLLGASALRRFFEIVWPQIRVPALLLGYVVFLLSIWDVETALLIVPPGGETAASKVFNLLHYGHNAQVDALCVIMLVMAVLPVLVSGTIFKFSQRWGRRTGALLLCGLLITGGCSKETNEHANFELESRFFQEVAVIGKRGTGAGEFNKPRSVAVDGEDNLYVVDMTGRVQKFSPEGDFILAWQMPETKLGRPKGMSCDSDGNIIVIEPHYARFNHFDVEGTLMRQWGKHGTNVGTFHLPRAVVETSDHRFVVSEFGMIDRLQIFDAVGSGNSKIIGGPGTREGEFDRPEGMGIDGEDRIYVADSCNHRIQVFDRDGVFLRSYGGAGGGVGELSYPYDIRIDANGFQFVCEFGNSRIQVFDARDQSVETIGEIGAKPGQFFNPWGIAFDSMGNLYIADSQNHRVQKLIRRDS